MTSALLQMAAMSSIRFSLIRSLAAFLLTTAAAAGGATMTGSDAENGPAGRAGQEILVAGANAVANGQAPARITIDVANRPAPDKAMLELFLAPAEVVPNEAYFVLVSTKTTAGEQRIGAVSFFPPRRGVPQAFYLDASGLLAEMAAHDTTRAELLIALAPASRKHGLTKSSVRVIDARLVAR